MLQPHQIRAPDLCNKDAKTGDDASKDTQTIAQERFRLQQFFLRDRKKRSTTCCCSRRRSRPQLNRRKKRLYLSTLGGASAAIQRRERTRSRRPSAATYAESGRNPSDSHIAPLRNRDASIDWRGASRSLDVVGRCALITCALGVAAPLAAWDQKTACPESHGCAARLLSHRGETSFDSMCFYGALRSPSI